MKFVRPGCRNLMAASHILGSLLFCFLVVLPLEAAEPSSRSLISTNLDSGWQFRAVANTDRSDVKEWHPAQVPGVVQTDLLHSAIIADPFDRDNEFHLQWIGLADWEYGRRSGRRGRARARSRRLGI